MPTTTPLPDPQTKYAAPEDLVRDRALSKAEKKSLLAHWQRDLEQLQTASDENMPSPVTPARHPEEGKVADMLRRVSNCLLRLEGD